MAEHKQEQPAAESPAPSRKPGGRPQGARPRKAKNFKKSVSDLFKYMRGHRGMLVFSLLLAVASVLCQILSPRFFGDLTNEIRLGIVAESGVDMQVVLRLGIIIGSMYVAGALLLFAQGFIMSTVTQRVIKKMRTQIAEKLNKLPLKYFDSSSFGDILSRLTNDIDTIGQSLSQSLVTLVTAVLTLAGVMIVMFIVHPIMALVAVGTTFVGFAIMIVIISRSQKFFVRQQKLLGELNGRIEETYAGHNVVKAYNGGAKAVKGFSNTNRELKKAVQNANFFSISMHPLMNFVANFGYLAVCVTGALLMVNNVLDTATGFGVIAEFLIYVRLFSQPLSQVSQESQSMQSAIAASERVFEFLQEQEMADESGKPEALPEAIRGDVEFRNIKFGYDAEKTIIKNFSASVRAGQKVAIVGPTGAGKTTLVNLLMRFYEIDGGQILIDGTDTQTLTRGAVRNLFGMVLQDTWIFEGTVRDNIAYSNQNATQETIVEACKASNLDHFIRTLPKGYDTVLNEKASLSAGQRQLITIARAFVANKPMLILDEATSSVDTRTEVLIQEAMERLTKGRTTFVIAHRLSTIKNADLILVLKDGDVIETGNHETLLAQGGFYADLYNSQFEE